MQMVNQAEASVRHLVVAAEMEEEYAILQEEECELNGTSH